MKKSFRAAALIGLTLPVSILACLNVEGVSLTGIHKDNLSLPPAQRLRAVMQAADMPAAYAAMRDPGAIIQGATKPSAPARPLAAAPEGTIAVRDTKEAESQAATAEAKAVALVLRKNYSAAIAILENLEKDAPGRYGTAVNLGTAHELSGDNRKALQWISEGIRRNPASHEGTEWLHALILEAKLQLEKNSEWLRDHHVIGLDSARVKDPAYRLQAGARSLSVAEVEKALDYQLLERMLLVKPKDAVVADLLYTYALIESGEGNRDSALDLLGLSREYGFAVPALLDELTKQLKTR